MPLHLTQCCINIRECCRTTRTYFHTSHVKTTFSHCNSLENGLFEAILQKFNMTFTIKSTKDESIIFSYFYCMRINHMSFHVFQYSQHPEQPTEDTASLLITTLSLCNVSALLLMKFFYIISISAPHYLSCVPQTSKTPLQYKCTQCNFQL